MPEFEYKLTISANTIEEADVLRDHLLRINGITSVVTEPEKPVHILGKISLARVSQFQ